jgi:hypothetical protein
VLGFLGRFGRARELRQLDDALRAVDVHPAMVPDAVELTAVRLLQAERQTPGPADYARTAELMAYCMIGASNFTAANDEAMAEAVAARIVAAIADPDGLDARLVLLLLHAGVVHPSVVSRFGLEAG